MKALKLGGLGTVVWGLSLLAPEVNQLPIFQMMIGLVLGLEFSTLAYQMCRHCNLRRQRNRSRRECLANAMPPVVIGR